MGPRIVATLTLFALLAMPGAATFDPARNFLMTAFNLSAADIGRLDRGDVVSRTLEVKNRREVATLGIVRIKTSPSRYVERLADITTFKRADDVLQIGTFSSRPQPEDMASLIIDEPELKRLRECRVENCEMRLSAAGIERVRRDIDWHASDSSRKASLLMRQLLTMTRSLLGTGRMAVTAPPERRRLSGGNSIAPGDRNGRTRRRRRRAASSAPGRAEGLRERRTHDRGRPLGMEHLVD